jgi:hypothetical protein
MQGTTMPVVADAADSEPPPVPVVDSYLDDIENMVADREVNDDEVEHLLSERLLDGFLLLERACPACTTPLVKQPLDTDTSNTEPWTPTESKKAISKIQKMHSSGQDSPMSCATTPATRTPAPIPGVPFCVHCKAHCITHESEIQHLDAAHNTMKHQGKILVDLVPAVHQFTEPDMYETTTITSTSTQFQPAAALRNIGGNSCSPMSTRTARTTSSGLLALAASSMIPTTPTRANTNVNAKSNTNVKSTVAGVPPTTLDEEKSVVPVVPEDDEIEVSITPAPTPVAMVPQLSSPAHSTLLAVAISEDQEPPPQQEQLAVAQEKKEMVDDHEDDALIEICDEDEENNEMYEVIHMSDDADNPIVEYTMEGSSKSSPPARSKTHPSPTGEETDVAFAHAAQIDMTLSNLEEKEVPVTPKPVTEQTVTKQIPQTSATTDKYESAGEKDNEIPEYSVR